MLLRSQQFVIESRLPPDTVLAQLQLRAHELSEAALSPAGRAAEVLGWTVRARNGQVVVTPRIASQSNFLPVFVGELRPTATGSVMQGRLRVHWFTRALLLVWVTNFAAVTTPGNAEAGIEHDPDCSRRRLA
jgi:hypothetical protein